MISTKRNLAFLAGFIFTPVFALGTITDADSSRLQKLLGVPTSIARVSDAHLQDGVSFPEIILIQDVHRHPEVQGHIAAMILYGARQWNVKDLFVEGAFHGTPVPLAGRTTGAEIALAMNPDLALTLHGLEDVSLYVQHVAAYEQVERLRRGALRELETSRLLENGLDLSTAIESENRYALMRRLLLLRLKPADYLAYQDNRQQCLAATSLGQAIQSAETFYEMADERSRVFTKRLSENRSEGTRLAVVGGFHTAQMALELEKRGLSYVILRPEVTRSGGALYEQGMLQTISALKLR